MNFKISFLPTMIINKCNPSIIVLFSFLTITSPSCKKFVETTPPVTMQTAESVYNSDASAISVINGVYTIISRDNSNSSDPRIPNISMWLALSADEFDLYTGAFPGHIAYYQNLYSTITGHGTEFWNNTYPIIFTLNSAIEGISTSTKLTAGVKKQLLGEAKFLRAFFYFYLTNLYGDVPLAITSDYTKNAIIKRSPKSDVYAQIIIDLKDAKNLLNPAYVKNDAVTAFGIGSEERIKPNQSAAAALLARVYLYTKSWEAAEQEASEVISNVAFYSLTQMNDVFLKNSAEAILQLQPVDFQFSNTADAPTFIIPSTGVSDQNPVYLSSILLSSFESGDARRFSQTWIDSVIVSGVTYYFPTKYKVNTPNAPVTEYTMLLRLAEQYLIRAEARAQQNKIAEAKSDLNAVRTRAGLAGTAANDQASMISAIMHERQVELFTELGHRWFDLKRTNTIDPVMSAVSVQKGSTWQSFKQWFPIPLGDLQANPNLVQNSGY